MLRLTNARLGGPGGDSFEHRFADGKITVVLGANRAGKTDLCRLIAGLHTIATGELGLDGLVLDGLPPQRRPVSMVYQAFVNYPNLSVHDNIASPLIARRVPVIEQRARVRELADRLQIGDLLGRMPHELSGGQQQRVAIARALARDAAVLLLDEPLVNLDFKLREALQNELRDLLSASGTVVIYTSSDPRDAFALGDEVLLLSGGRKIQAGTPLDVYRQPASLAAMELLADPGVNRYQRDGRTCAIRPEHLAFGAPVDGSSTLAFDMLVSGCETNGDESFIHGRVEDQDWVVRCHGMHSLQTGNVVALHARHDDIVSF